ncbi:electron transport complex subunit E [Prosthecochloris sp. N3]|uniref:Ion-translocating oxidoreductase complex subunit E n=1 Tax=Prosthecochloris ethylica TaxID=2743976 RepID=A0ABR9XST8_9CHLB|nr:MULTISPECIES: electron transport complex subunit E [Prosthecochloris]MEC9487065.1 electron transport complex subunit E [Prosthecochloris sp.]MBF0585359.1 electron transport complex subunit E [Prosthecochloris ethylica]MBF0636895.1 electron transport complex subunit E [Prosthecochloris ethylica]NUK46588.1 electron transport complex subunit E [Prosthecochloris ethylica]RNA64795.1 electron transport complex subunit E [Prosthecochloris sp. ZM_2]
MNEALNILTRGFVRENPVTKMLLGLCPVLAVTTTAFNGLGMGLATTFVLLGSNVVISLAAKAIPNTVRIPSFILVIATFVTIVDLLIKAYSPELNQALGLFIPLIVVNCMILGRAEAFASRNGLVYSIIDAVGMGLGFTFALLLLSAFREVLGAGTIFNIPIVGEDANTMLVFALPPGAFAGLGLIIAGLNSLEKKMGGKS